MTTDITELAQSLKAAADREMICRDGAETSEIWERTVTPENILALVEALEKAQGMEAYWKTQCPGITDHCEELQARIAELESRTVKLPDGWQFEECEIEGCENGAIFSVGTGSRNIHLCDKCAHEPQNSRLKKSPLSKRLPFKMSAGIKVEAE
ncbi:hypothetical protein AAHW96_18740 [Klebsiella quasipneumoniae subsp. similipneumoniae]|uniref:hypothetical protein n=1 Tax=Klebsiella pneumoniae complex TaxID=3390273 RepID=UPI000E06A6AC|nr:MULTISPECIES: hypothetical protein [Klebsiella]UVY33631.1 MAG: hypothetical protein [Bacteriophage sp.]STR08132.1 Uncharacterised protein [Klebsiella quasipneumoniae]HDS8107667.1 hypothetical protein [Klebsiella quasipneumoniae subsp. similipneumoniae]